LEVRPHSNKRILIGTFYRPPNSDNNYFCKIEDSIGLAIDTGINDIIVLGDFNLKTQLDQAKRKIDSISQQFALDQCIQDPTHFTETSSSIIDLIFVSNKESVIFSGVGEPFLDQTIRYHCPVFVILKFKRPSSLCYKRKIWKYDSGNYDSFRSNLSNIEWNNVYSDNIDTFTKTLTNTVLATAADCIPSKEVTVRPAKPPWLSSEIKLKIRKRKRAYRKAKTTNSTSNWTRFCVLRNDVVSLVRLAKSNYYDSLAFKLKSNNYSSRDWWKVLKSFLTVNVSKTLPPLVNIAGELVFDELQKAEVLNNFFAQQTSLDESGHVLPELATIEN